MGADAVETWANDPDAESLSAEEEPSQLTESFLVLRLDGALYAFRTQDVHEVAAAQHPVPVPTAPETVLGVVHLRSRIIAVLDLRRLLGSPPTDLPGAPSSPAEGQRRLMLLGAAGMRFAIVADELLGLRDMAAVEVRTAAERAAPIGGSFDIKEGVVTVLQADALMGRLLAHQTGKV